ncbi:MAG: hypothetical protein CMF77_03640 [Candidatus Marinimicrobia bacterium]|nr:hypothetical protein [Candidatus Neomarinimicrobiota bacterium]
MKQSFLVIIPVYNGEATIPSLLKRLSAADIDNFLFVNDGSTDGTGKLLAQQSLNQLDHTENRGKGAALMTGLNYAYDNGFDYVVTMDVDLQHPPESIVALLRKVDKQSVVVAWRRDYSKMPPHRIFSNAVTSLLLSIRSNMQIKDSQCGFRAFPSKIITQLTFIQHGFQFESELLMRAVLAGYQIRHVPIPTIYAGEKSAMRNVYDTFKFIAMYLRSFLW